MLIILVLLLCVAETNHSDMLFTCRPDRTVDDDTGNSHLAQQHLIARHAQLPAGNVVVDTGARSLTVSVLSPTSRG